MTKLNKKLTLLFASAALCLTGCTINGNKKLAETNDTIQESHTAIAESFTANQTIQKNPTPNYGDIGNIKIEKADGSIYNGATDQTTPIWTNSITFTDRENNEVIASGDGLFAIRETNSKEWDIQIKDNDGVAHSGKTQDLIPRLSPMIRFTNDRGNEVVIIDGSVFGTKNTNENNSIKLVENDSQAAERMREQIRSIGHK